MTPTYDTRNGVVINRAKFDVCAPSTFGGDKTGRRTNRIAFELRILDKLTTNPALKVVKI